MDSNPTLLWALAALAVPFLVLLFVKLKRNQDEIAALIETKFDGKKMILRDPAAYLIAQQSRGCSQNQGNGNLILTEDELFFAMNLPKTAISIPMENLDGTARVHRMCGNGRLRKFLKIRYRDERGEEDALGIHLKEMDRWEAAIKEIRSCSESRAG